jgi:hypothetical protein
MIRWEGEQKMAEEVKLTPGWLLRDVRSAAERLDPSQHKVGIATEPRFALNQRSIHRDQQTHRVEKDFRDRVSS